MPAQAQLERPACRILSTGQIEEDDMKIRVKFGNNPYDNCFSCSRCGSSFESGGFILRIEHSGTVVDIPICSECFDKGDLFEGLIEIDRHHTAHPIGRA